MIAGLARAAVLAAIVGAAMTPSSAQASGAPDPWLVKDEALPSLALFYTAIPFLTLDVIFLAAGRPLPRQLSVLQIAVAGLLVPIATLLTVHDSGFELPERRMFAGIAIASLIVFPAHGIYNLLIFDAWSKRRQRERAEALERRERLRETYEHNCALGANSC